MAHVNELKYATLSGVVGKTGVKLNELEREWLAPRHLLAAAQGATNNELWYLEFIVNGVGTGHEFTWNENAHWWLDTAGIAPGALSERWARRIEMKSDSDTQFSGSFVPQPRDESTPKLIDARVVYPRGEVNAPVIDKEFQVDDLKQTIADAKSITVRDDGKHTVTLVDGSEKVGRLTGLEQVEVDFGNTKTVLDLAKATEVSFDLPDTSLETEFTIVVRDAGKEIHRLARNIDGMPSLPGLSIKAYKGGRKAIPMPAPITDIVLAGGGQRMLAVLGTAKKLAVVNTTSGEILKLLPLASDDVLVAGTLKHIIVFDRANSLIERWSLDSLKKERMVKPPFNGVIKAVCAGEASNGPVLIFWASGTEALSRASYTMLNVDSMDERKIETMGGRFHASFRDANHLRASANGRVFGMWATSHSPQGLNVFTLLDKRLVGRNEHTSVGHVRPGPDGMYLFTGIAGVYSNTLKAQSVDRRTRTPCVPTSHPRIYVSVPAEPGAQRNLGSNPFKGVKPAVHVVGSEAPLIHLPDLELGSDPVNRSWTASDFSLDKRVYFLVQANALVTVPFSNDQIIVQKFDLEKELKNSKIDYFYVSSTPPREFTPGKKYKYQIRVASKDSRVKYELSSGPDKMRLSKSGELTWSVPSDFDEESVDVIISITNSQQQITYETFSLLAAPSS